MKTWGVDPIPLTFCFNDQQRKYDLYLGHDHYLQFTRWSPDRDLNPQWARIPDMERIGAIIYHKSKDGKTEWCSSGIWFDNAVTREVFPGKTMWIKESEEPLTVSPSILCMICGDHGHIRNGKWEPA